MKAEERRSQLLYYLQEQKRPVSAGSLASLFGVSRQIIVGDIALLRAGGTEIEATPRGYLLQTTINTGVFRKIACRHSTEAMQKELEICIDQGCSVLDVIVEHPVYGQITGQLQLHSRYDILQFMQRVEGESAHALSELTDGIHLHTLKCPDMDAYHRVCQTLTEAGILLDIEE